MKADFVNFRKVKQLVSITSLLGHYGLRLRPVNEHTLRGRCPLPTHSSENSIDSFSVHTDKNIWACHSGSCISARGGRSGGSILDLVSIMEGCSIREAAQRLVERFMAPSVPMPGTTRVMADRVLEECECRGNKPLTFTLRGLDSSHPYIRRRGITEETARIFGTGFYAGKGSMSGRIVIPIHNERGELVAYAGRSTDGTKPKYKMPAGFLKSAALFNLHRVESEAVIVVEGFFDCMKVWQAGYRNVVALMGSSLSPRQEKLLERFSQVALFLDGDDAGRRATERIAEAMARSHRVRVVSPGAGKQPDQLSSAELQVLLSR